MTAAQIVYTSFDRFPSPKGAATHIAAFVATLGRNFPNLDLVTIPSATPDDLARQDWISDGVTHHTIAADGEHLFERVLHFRAGFKQWWRTRFGSFKVPVVHFRSIYEGYPIAREKDSHCQHMIYEVNGLPSIELKYHYPQVAEDSELLSKLRAQEELCLTAADRVITVSNVNRDYLIGRGVNADKIRVIRNGVDLNVFTLRPVARCTNDDLQLLYTGTMTSWQGVDLAIDALALYCRDARATLKIVGPIRPRERKRLERHIWKSGVSDCVTLNDAVSKPELVQAYHECDVALAPLTRHDRNTQQGCCPLKVIEAMATGTPLVATRIPVVEELAENEREALLVRTGSARSIKNALVRLRCEATLADTLTTNARQRVEKQFSWEFAQSKLCDVYSELLSGS